MPQAPLMPVAEAQARLLADMKLTLATEKVSYLDALGRVVAQSPVAQVNVPPCDNSSMDGYAVNTRDLSPDQPVTLSVSQRICAGDAPAPLVAGTCARIFTGAAMPQGANAIVIQENVTVEEGGVVFPAGVEAGANIRPCGQDVQKGADVLPVGHRIQPMDIGLLASTNTTELTVFAPLKVAIVSTGNELVEPGQSCAHGQIYNSNGVMLSALLAQMGVTQVERHHCRDDLDETLALLSDLMTRVDVIISSGGVSVGDEDHVKTALMQLGQLDFWKIAIKPGKPLAYGRLGQTPFFGLPGNPASALITFMLFVRPALQVLQGGQAVLPELQYWPAGFSRSKPNSRQEYLRVRLQDGELKAHTNQSSGMLSSASWATGLAVVEPHQTLSEGDRVGYLDFKLLI